MTLEDLQERARSKKQRIAFPDSTDSRTIFAVRYLVDNNVCSPVLIGNPVDIESSAKEINVNIGDVEIVNVKSHVSDTTDFLLLRRAHKGLSQTEAQELASSPLYTAGFMVATGLVDGAVAGSQSTTSDVLRAGIVTIGTRPTTSTVSSFFLMIWPGGGQVLTYSDCGVIPQPTSEQLVDIARDASLNHELLTGERSRIAFLSFSTKGSADHESLNDIRNAATAFKALYPEMISDGELQVDAAMVPSIAQLKAPESPVLGQANVLIFPDLNAGNIAYKLTQRLAGATALGPIIQGLAKPYCDLSRGCSAEDIVNVASITAIMAANA